MNCLTNAEVGSAAADVTDHRVINLRVLGRFVCREQSSGRHDLAGLAISALMNLLRDPRLLDGVLSVRAQSLNCEDSVSYGALDGGLAGTDGLSIEMNRTCATHADAA